MLLTNVLFFYVISVTHKKTGSKDNLPVSPGNALLDSGRNDSPPTLLRTVGATHACPDICRRLERCDESDYPLLLNLLGTHL